MPNVQPRQLTRWALAYDAGNQEDIYAEHPSEFMIRQTQRVCPDEPVLVLRIVGHRREVVETRPPVGNDDVS